MEGRNQVEIKEGSPPTGAVADPLPLECGLMIVMAYKLDVEATLKMLEREPKYCRPADETLRMVKNKFVTSDSIEVSDVKVPLTCPVSRVDWSRV